MTHAPHAGAPAAVTAGRGLCPPGQVGGVLDGGGYGQARHSM